MNTAQRLRGALVPFLSGLVLVAVGLGLWHSLGSSYADGAPQVQKVSSVGAAGLSADRVFLIDCSHHARVRPRSFDVACGGDNAALKQIRWSSWGRSSARASAVFDINTCEPSCADAHYKRYPVTVLANRVANSDGTGRFRHLRLTFPKAAPAGTHGHTLSVDLDALRGN